MFWLRNKNALKNLNELVMIAQAGATFIVRGNKPAIINTKFLSVKLLIFSLPISFNICFGCSKEPSY